MENKCKTFLFLGMCIAWFGCMVHAAHSQEIEFPNPDVTISMDLQDASLKDVLKIFSIQSGLNFIASEAVQDRKITLYLDRVPIQQAIDKLFKANGLYYELDEDSNVFIVKDWGKPSVDTVTKVFYLKYASVSSSAIMGEKAADTTTIGSSSSSSGSSGSSGITGTKSGGGASGSSNTEGIAGIIKKLLSENGSVIEDARTNSLIVTDIPSKLPGIAQLIATLDVPQPQIMLEVEMLDVSKSLIDKMGFKFNSSPYGVNAPFAPLTFLSGKNNNNGLFFGDPTRKDFNLETAGAAGSVIFGKTYAGVLDFLRAQTDTKDLARPRILTLNNETAEIKIVTEEAVGEKRTESGTTGTSNTTTEAERYETGVSLRVTPQVDIESGEITMLIVPTVAEAKRSDVVSSSGVNFWNPEVRTTKSIVRVKDSETIILGGLIRNQLQQTVTKVPILGNIPIMGALFRHKDKTKDTERELLIFITPHVLKNNTTEYARFKNTQALTDREQDTVTGERSRQSAINASLNSFDRIK